MLDLESNVYERVNEIVDGLRFRSFDKVYSSIKSELPNVTKIKTHYVDDLSRCEKLMKNKFYFILIV